MHRSFVINLARSAERLRVFRRREQTTGLHSEVFPAVDGRELAILPPHRPSLTVGEVGCVLSHREVLRTISTLPDQWVIVLEDDVLFWPGFQTQVERVLADADDRAIGLVQLGWGPHPPRPNHLALLRDRFVTARPIRRAAQAVRPSVHVEPPMAVGSKFGWGAHCYAVRPHFARTAVDLLDAPRIHVAFDVYLYLLRELYPEQTARSRFSLAGQALTGQSTTVPNRPFFTYQTDPFGRVVRRRAVATGADAGLWAGWEPRAAPKPGPPSSGPVW